jgi:hypothetical protein
MTDIEARLRAVPLLREEDQNGVAYYVTDYPRTTAVVRGMVEERGQAAAKWEARAVTYSHTLVEQAWEIERLREALYESVESWDYKDWESVSMRFIEVAVTVPKIAALRPAPGSGGGLKPCGHGPDSDYRRCSPCHKLLGERDGRYCPRCLCLATRVCRPCQTPDLR